MNSMSKPTNQSNEFNEFKPMNSMKYHANPTNERSERQVNEATPPWRPVAQEKKADESASKTQELPNSAKVQTKFLQEPLENSTPGNTIPKGDQILKSRSQKKIPRRGLSWAFSREKVPRDFFGWGTRAKKPRFFQAF